MKVVLILLTTLFALANGRPTLDKIAEALINLVDDQSYPYPHHTNHHHHAPYGQSGYNYNQNYGGLEGPGYYQHGQQGGYNYDYPNGHPNYYNQAPPPSAGPYPSQGQQGYYGGGGGIGSAHGGYQSPPTYEYQQRPNYPSYGYQTHGY